VNKVAKGSTILLDVDFFAFTVSAPLAPAMGPASRRTSTDGLGIEIPLL
jgi:hypothetical protein